MARRPRASRLETRTARLKLPVRLKPYDFTTISPGISVGYRRNVASGAWVLRAADGHGGNWTKRVGLADDFEDADGEHVLTFWQAQERARKLARGGADSGRPATVNDAVDAYERDLIARGGSVANAGRVRKHLPATLAVKPVGLLTARELSAWRDSLLANGMKPATAVRLAKAFKAAVNLCSRYDHRIANTSAWRDGLSGIAEGASSRNVQRLDDDQVRALITAAYETDHSFGVYLETAAVTGARLSQIARLVVSDLQADNGMPRLLMPSSKKGGRGRKPGKRPIPITAELASKLRSNRPPDTPLLLRGDGRAWQWRRSGDHVLLYARAAERAGIKGTTIYALRHSSVIRSLLANVPIRVVAALHDTSVVMLERVYSSHITDYSDALARPALLATPPLADDTGTKVVPLARRRP
jgi:integrase